MSPSKFAFVQCDVWPHEYYSRVPHPHPHRIAVVFLRAVDTRRSTTIRRSASRHPRSRVLLHILREAQRLMPSWLQLGWVGVLFVSVRIRVETAVYPIC